MPLAQMLCGWYAYLAVLSLLAALSSGPRTRSRVVAAVACGASLILVVALMASLSIAPYVLVALKVTVVVAGALILAFNRREDTRLIALLITGAALIPLALHFWQP